VEGTVFSNKWLAVNEEAICRRTIYCINVNRIKKYRKITPCGDRRIIIVPT
jgi:hypothetical protein